MLQLKCSEVWGGIKNQNLDARSAALTTSLYSSACDSGKGGDIYYLSVCQGDMLTRVAIADVVGHGEKVSRVSQWLFDILSQRMNGGDGCEVLADLNRLAAQRGFEALTTAAILSLHKPDSQACFSYAGHHPMLIRKRGESRWQAVELEKQSPGPANLPLGIDIDMRYDLQSLPVNTGDRILLYTDGVLEAPRPDGQLFGRERFLAALEQAGDTSLPDLKAAVLTSLHDFIGGEPCHDDVTLLAIEVH
jgi:sigma-B regulation protein RsbU (phosphoserine phosphatase)